MAQGVRRHLLKMIVLYQVLSDLPVRAALDWAPDRLRSILWDMSATEFKFHWSLVKHMIRTVHYFDL
jgi:hypothetical protein